MRRFPHPLRLLGPGSRAVWVACALAYPVSRLLRSRDLLRPPLAGQLTDLLCLPLVLGLVLMAQRLAGRPRNWTLPWWHGLAAVAIYAVYFELLLPRGSTRFTGDILDVLAYGAGWLLFEMAINRP